MSVGLSVYPSVRLPLTVPVTYHGHDTGHRPVFGYGDVLPSGAACSQALGGWSTCLNMGDSR